MMIIRGWMGGLVRSLAKDGAGLWASANVALRERKLATRLSSIIREEQAEQLGGKAREASILQSYYRAIKTAGCISNH